MPLTDDELTSIFNGGVEDDPPPHEVTPPPDSPEPEQIQSDDSAPPINTPAPAHEPDDFDDQLTRTRLGRRVSKMQQQLENVVTRDDLTRTLDDYFKRLELTKQPATPQAPTNQNDDFFGIFGDEQQPPVQANTPFEIPDEVLERKLDQIEQKRQQKTIDTVTRYQDSFIKEVLSMENDDEFGDIHVEVLAKLTDPKSGNAYNKNFSGFKDPKGDAFKNYTKAALAVIKEKAANAPQNPFRGTPPAGPTGPRGNPPSGGNAGIKLPEFDEQSKEYIQSMGLDESTLVKIYSKK